MSRLDGSKGFLTLGHLFAASLTDFVRYNFHLFIIPPIMDKASLFGKTKGGSEQAELKIQEKSRTS